MFKKTLGVALLLVVLASLCMPFPVVNAAATVSIDPLTPTVWGADETFTVNITVTDVSGLYGWEGQLFYDSSILSCLSASEGPFLENAGETYFNVSITDDFDTTHGRIKAFNTLLGQIPGVDGSGVLLTVTFLTKALGISILDIENVILSDINSNPMPHTEVDGGVQVVRQICDVAITNLQVSSILLVSGQILDLQVTAANPGYETENFLVTIFSNETVIGSHVVVGLLPHSDRVFNVSWNTGVISPNATCLIKAEASQVPDEEIIENNIFVYGTVAIVTGVHNIAVTGVSCSSDRVYQGDTMYIQVTLANKGDYTENVNVTAYYDMNVIGTQRVDNFTYGTSVGLIFLWDTYAVAVNNTFVIKAVASPVQGETILQDNTLADGNVTVYPPAALSIKITQVIPCDQLGRPVSSFAAGTTANFLVTLNCTVVGTKRILLTINLLDAEASTIGVVSFQGPVASGVTTFILGVPIPTTAALGYASVHANALSDWPHLGGTPYCPEKSATFGIGGS
jgi:hypothetical protein